MWPRSGGAGRDPGAGFLWGGAPTSVPGGTGRLACRPRAWSSPRRRSQRPPRGSWRPRYRGARGSWLPLRRPMPTRSLPRSVGRPPTPSRRTGAARARAYATRSGPPPRQRRRQPTRSFAGRGPSSRSAWRQGWPREDGRGPPAARPRPVGRSPHAGLPRRVAPRPRSPWKLRSSRPQRAPPHEPDWYGHDRCYGAALEPGRHGFHRAASDRDGILHRVRDERGALADRAPRLGRGVISHDDDPRAARGLDRGERAERAVVIRAEHRIDPLPGREQIIHLLLRHVADAALDGGRRHHADVRVVAERLTEAGDAVSHARHRRLIEDDDIPASAQPPPHVGTQEAPALAIVARDVRDHRPSVARNVGGEHGNPGAIRLFDRADDAARVDRRDHDRVRPRIDEVVHLRRLPRQIPLAGNNLQVEPQAVGRLLHNAFEVLIEDVRVVEQRDTAERAAARAPLAARAGPREERCRQQPQQRLTHAWYDLRVWSTHRR